MQKPRKGTYLIRVAEVERLMQAKGLTMEMLARKCDMTVRNLSRNLSGQPAYLGTIATIAKALGLPSCSSLIEREPGTNGALENPQPPITFAHEESVDGGTLKITFELTAHSGAPAQSAPTQAENIRAIMAFLQKFLPDNTGLAIIGLAAGTLVIGVKKSVANEAALAADLFRQRLGALGVKEFTHSEKKLSSENLIAPEKTQERMEKEYQILFDYFNSPEFEKASKEFGTKLLEYAKKY